VSIFNDTLVLQVLLTLVLVLVMWSVELFYVSVNAILFLLLISLYLYSLNLDILVNFLVVIDLGLFFALTALILNFSTLYSNTLGLSISPRQIYKFTLFLSLFVIYKLTFNLLSPLVNTPETVLVYLLQENLYFNWLNFFNSLYSNDLNLLNDVYFNFNIGEFVVLNFLLYLAILISYLLVVVLKSLNLLNFTKSKKLPILTFFKTQGLQKQLMQSASVRVWSKSKKLSNGFTENLS